MPYMLCIVLPAGGIVLSIQGMLSMLPQFSLSGLRVEAFDQLEDRHVAGMGVLKSATRNADVA